MRSAVSVGTTNITPSKPRSERPFSTASAAPPMTDTMTTSAVVPSTMPTSVRAERSLWARISASEVRTASVMYTLLVPQGFDGIEARGADGGVEAEEDPHRHREEEADQHVQRGHHHRLLDEGAHGGGGADAEAEAQKAAHDRHHDALHHELGQDVETGRPQRLARSHLTDPLVEGGEEDVHDHDPAHEQRDRPADEEGDVVDPALLVHLLHEGGAVEDLEVLDPAVGAAEDGLDLILGLVHLLDVPHLNVDVGDLLVLAVTHHAVVHGGDGDEDNPVHPLEVVAVGGVPVELLALHHPHHRVAVGSDADRLAHRRR